MTKEEIEELVSAEKNYKIIKSCEDYVEVINAYLKIPYHIWTTKGFFTRLPSLVYFSPQIEKDWNISKANMLISLLTNFSADEVGMIEGIFFYYDEDDFKWLKMSYDDETIHLVKSQLEQGRESAYIGESNLILINAKKITESYQGIDRVSLATVFVLKMMKEIYIQNHWINFLAHSNKYPYRFNDVLTDQQVEDAAKEYAENKVSSAIFLETLSELFPPAA